MAKQVSQDNNKWKKRIWLIALSPLLLVGIIVIAALASGLPDVEALANPKINLAPATSTTPAATSRIIERFGRFPHRNAALGRETSAA